MGEFSWLYASKKTKQANINPYKKIKLLIPKEYIDTYGSDNLVGVLDEYGRFSTEVKGKEYDLDLYGVLAFMNKHMCEYSGDSIESEWIRDDNPMGLSDTNENRNGVGFGCYAFEILCSDFPLKLVPYSYKGTYEECKGVSFNDPSQGYGILKWLDKGYINFSGQMIEPINFNERPSTTYSDKYDENFNIKQEYLKSLNKYEPLVKKAIIYELNEKKEEYKQYKINRDKFFNTYKNSE